MKVSLFSGITPKVSKQISINTALDRIKSGKSKALVNRVRKASGKEAANKIKINLPAVTFAGEFSRRSNAELLEASGLALLDFDNVNNPGPFKREVFASNKFVYAAWISPGGKGVKAAVRIPVVQNDHEYKVHYIALLELFNDADADASTKDISRLCFESYDPELIRRAWESTDIFTAKKETKAPKQPKKISRAQPDQNITNDERFDRAIKILDNKHIHYAEGSRNNFIAELAMNLNKLGVPLLDVISFAANNFTDLPVKERENTIHGVYKRQVAEFNIWEVKRHAKGSGFSAKRKEGKTKEAQVKSNLVECPYIRVGCDYFKVIIKPDRFGTKSKELKKWSSREILLDYGKEYLKAIPHYDDFIIIPNNNGASASAAGNLYNMYSDFPHKPKEGALTWTMVLLNHVFGNQIEAGIEYMQVLYRYPKKRLPVLILVSKLRVTGKTTFIDWLNMIFGANVAMLDSQSMYDNFNSEYAASNIICIDETLIEKQSAIEKVKSLATKKFISVNSKNVSKFKLPFYGKLVLASNNEDRLIKIDDEEVRFWIRKLGETTVKNHNILEDMVDEIPAFLYYLNTLEAPDFTKSRHVLTEEQTKNEWLEVIKKESKSELYKELNEYLREWFDNHNKYNEIKLTPGDIKDKFFRLNHNFKLNHIRRVLRTEFNMKPEEPNNYYPFDESIIMKRGRCYVFNKEYFSNIP